jgi:periplasmic divalent cation tolerance protein
MEKSYLLVLTTLGARDDAHKLAATLVEERLAACVNILPEMDSTYRWKGAVESERERQFIIKTTSDRLAALQARLHELHPYELPEFVVLPIGSGSERYLNWIGESTSKNE